MPHQLWGHPVLLPRCAPEQDAIFLGEAGLAQSRRSIVSWLLDMNIKSNRIFFFFYCQVAPHRNSITQNPMSPTLYLCDCFEGPKIKFHLMKFSLVLWFIEPYWMRFCLPLYSQPFLAFSQTFIQSRLTSFYTVFQVIDTTIGLFRDETPALRTPLESISPH